MIMALIVLLGFGVLFMFAFDEDLQGGGQTIEALVAQQKKEIAGFETLVAHGSTSLEQAPARAAKVEELLRAKLQSRQFKKSIISLSTEIQSAEEDLIRRLEIFESYKNDYRAHARAAAKGMELETLETAGGIIYKQVSIREVTAIGIQIRHTDGHKRIPFEDLPEAMKDRFQYDPGQKAEALAGESAVRQQHDAAVAVARMLADEQTAQQREIDAARARDRLAQEISVKVAQVTRLLDEIRGLEGDLQRAAADATAARAAGRMHLNKSGNISGHIRSKKNRIATLTAEINQLRARL